MKNNDLTTRFESKPVIQGRLRKFNCPVEMVFSVIGGKWKAAIIYNLKGKPVRFGLLKSRMAGVTTRMLAKQLRELEKDGVIYREVFPVVPARVEYGLTDFGETLAPVMNSMAKWGKDLGWTWKTTKADG